MTLYQKSKQTIRNNLNGWKQSTTEEYFSGMDFCGWSPGLGGGTGLGGEILSDWFVLFFTTLLGYL